MGWEDAAKHLSEPLVKLIEVSSKGAGNVFSLCFAKRIVDNKKYEIEQIGCAIEGNGSLLGEVKYANDGVSLESLGSKVDSLEERSKLRKEYMDLKGQNNIERIVTHSAISLNNEESVSSEPVDEDWISRFFKYAEDVTSEDMQEIWGRVLTGEIKQPSSYSLRTLEVLRNLTKKDAELIIKIAKYKILCNNDHLIFRGKTDDFLRESDLTFKEQLHLSEIGILQANRTLSYTFEKTKEDSETYIELGKYLIKVSKEKDTPKCSFPVLIFTSIGIEILKLVSSMTDEKYFNEFCKELLNLQLKVEYAIIVNKLDGGIYKREPWLKFEI